MEEPDFSVADALTGKPFEASDVEAGRCGSRQSLRSSPRRSNNAVRRPHRATFSISRLQGARIATRRRCSSRVSRAGFKNQGAGREAESAVCLPCRRAVDVRTDYEASAIDCLDAALAVLDECSRRPRRPDRPLANRAVEGWTLSYSPDALVRLTRKRSRRR